MKTTLRPAFVLLTVFTLFFTAPFAPAQSSGGNNALSFDGVNDYVDLGTNAPALGTNFTQEAWIKPQISSGNGYYGILGYSPPTGENDRSPCIFLHGRTTLHISFGTGSYHYSWDIDSILRSDEWNHVAVSCDGYVYRVYANGQEVWTEDIGPLVPGNTPVRHIGQVGGFYFRGQIDEVRLWSVARTAAEIRQGMNPLSGTEPNLVAYWKFDEGTGPTAHDTTTNHFDATLLNGPVWTNSTLFGFVNVTATVAPGLPGVGMSSVAWGDYDNDGRLDFLLTGVANSGHELSQVWRNTGSGFTNVTSTVAPGLPGVGYNSSVAWGDYDNDGRLDILLTGYTSSGGMSQVWRNTGSGFTNVTSTVAPGLPGVHASSVAWGDYDNDGRLDFLLTGYTSSGGMSQVWRNTGSGFTNVTSTVAPGLPGVDYSSVAWGDYDNDGRLDFLLTGRSVSGYISQLWRNTGSGFTNVTSTVAPGLPGVYKSSVAWGDYDNDGRLDFLLTGTKVNSVTDITSQLWRNTGSGFTNVTSTVAPGLPGVCGSSVAWGDYGNDGRLDFLLTGFTGSVWVSQLWRNTGSGFTNVTSTVAPGLGGVSEGSVAWGDYDNDGRLDFLLTGNGYSQVWQNIGGPANTPPTSPGALAVTGAGLTVNLSWTPGADAETPASGLTYNVRVGSTPGGSDIDSAQTSSIGFRRLPALGNVQQSFSLPLVSLRTGRIYWSVQAVDSAFAGSPFSAESSFTLWPVLGSESGLVPGDMNGDGIVSQAELDAVVRSFYATTPPQMSGLAMSGPGAFHFGLSNAVGLDFNVFASTNLVDWLVLSNVVPRLQINDPDAAMYPQRFYRLRWP